MWYDKTNVVFYKDSHNKRNKMFRKEFYIWKRSIHRNGNKTCQHLKKRQTSFMQENYKEKIYIRDLAGLIGMNEQYFCRFFKKVIGRSPMEYVNEYRIKKAIHYLKESDLTVTEICLECGYNNLGNFLREFRKYTSTTPLQYRRHSLKETQ